jgi:exodeoxyribonuclease VII large subunit
MVHPMEPRKFFTLQQLCASIKKRIEAGTEGRSFWVKAEVAGINAQKHIYLDLVQHHEGARVAVLRGIIWQYRMRAIRDVLGDELPNILRQGAEILFLASVHYSEVYGISLHIEEVDLSYSLGELERRKRATIDTLRAEGLFDLNRALPEPMVIQRIALIASVGSAAYTDLVQHLRTNEHGYQFHVQVFPSAVQGDHAPQELRAALAAIDTTLFDAVVLIRGGGSKLDLEAFNDLALCRDVALLPIPLMTGIGHDVDVSVVDMIAKSPHKTPTAIADHLIDKCLYFETSLNAFLVGIQRVMSDTFTVRKERMSTFAEMLRQRPRSFCQQQRGDLHTSVGQFARNATEQMKGRSRQMDQHVHALGVFPLRRMKQVEEPLLREMQLTLDQLAHTGLRSLLDRVNGMRDAIRLLDPEKTMARGFSVARLKGNVVTTTDELQVGDVLETTFAQGRAWSTINTIEPHG